VRGNIEKEASNKTDTFVILSFLSKANENTGADKANKGNCKRVIHGCHGIRYANIHQEPITRKKYEFFLLLGNKIKAIITNIM
jgi:hypothetical protein